MSTDVSLSIARLDASAPDYSSLVAHSDFVRSEDTVEFVCRHLRTRAVEYLPVLRDGKLAGLLSGSQLSGTMGAKFSFALYARRPVCSLPLQPVTAIQGSCPLVPLLKALFDRREATFHHDIALLDESGTYVGMIPIRHFALLQTRLLVEQLQALAASREEALAGARAKSRFLSNMSHELRTPLNGILGFSDLLLDTSLDVEQRDYVTTIRASGQSLLALVTDVLALTSLEQEHGATTMRRELVPVEKVLREMAEHFAAEARLKRLKLEVVVDKEARRNVETDAQRLRQAVSILIGNAIKFTAQGAVTVRLVEAGEHEVVIEVTDTGIGIPEGHLPRLFDPLNQADDTNTRRHGGLGVGLPLCRALVESLGGRVKAGNLPGSGACFQIRLRDVSRPSAVAA